MVVRSRISSLYLAGSTPRLGREVKVSNKFKFDRKIRIALQCTVRYVACERNSTTRDEASK